MHGDSPIGGHIKAANCAEILLIDRLFHGRLTWLTQAPFDRIIAAICILLALTVAPLEVVPFASAAPMGTIAMFGLALLVKDGLLVLVGTALSLVSVYVLFTNVIL